MFDEEDINEFFDDDGLPEIGWLTNWECSVCRNEFMVEEIMVDDLDINMPKFCPYCGREDSLQENAWGTEE